MLGASLAAGISDDITILIDVRTGEYILPHLSFYVATFGQVPAGR
jgi:hypothetical protein